jgi:Transglycosylase SLT domain
MAGQEIIFNFLSRGSAQLAGDFRKVGDDAALSSRGVKVLQDVIEKLGAKEDRTAAESKILAGALRQTGEAADRATAKAVLADAAIRRLGDDMKNVKPADVVVLTDKAQAKLTGIKAKAEELRAKFPQFTVQIDDKLAKAELDLFAAEATRKLDKLDKQIARTGITLSGLKLNPGLVGPALALIPALGTLTGVVAGAGAGLAGAFVAGGAALAAFGAVAKPVLSDALKASQAVNTAQNTYQATVKAGVPVAQAQATLQAANARAVLTYNAAIAGGANPAKALAAEHLALAKNQLAYNTATNAGTFNAKAYAAEQKAIGKAYADLSPQQIALSKQLGAMANAWQAVKAAQTPVVAGALQPWLKSVTDLTKQLGPIIAAVAPVIQYLGKQFDALINSAAFRGFRTFIAGTGSAAVSAGGSTIIDLVKSFMILLPKFDPLIREAVGWISRLGPAVLAWSSSKKAADDIQSFIRFFSTNGQVVGDLLKNIGGALKALAPGLTAGGTAELQIIRDFFGLVAKLPASFAKPITEVAGSLLILSKLGVLKVGVQLVGAAVKWLTGGLISITGADVAAAAIRAALVSGGAAVAAQIRAALTGGAIPGAAGAAGGAGAAGAAEGGAAGLGALLTPVLIGAAAGIALGIYLNKYHAQDHPPPPAQQGPRGTGGAAGPSPASINAWKVYDGLLSQAAVSADAVTKATAVINADFAAQAKAAAKAGTDIGALAATIAANGNATRGAASARAKLVTDLIAAGVNAGTAQTDVVNYSNAVAANGVKSAQAATARAKLVTDILAASSNARQGKTDLGTYTDTVAANGIRSDAAKTARAKLITDLVNSGLSAKTAAGLVDGLGASIGRLHGATVKIITQASGTGQIAITGTGWALGQGNIRFHAAKGAFVNAGSGPAADDVLARVSRGELIVPAQMVRAGAVDHLRGRIPGFAGGGFVGLENQIAAMVPGAGSIAGGDAGQAVRTGVAKAMAAAKAAVAKAALNAVGPSSGGGHVGWSPGAGVNQWRLTTLKALSLLGLSPGLVLDVLYQMMTESGGNPNIVNKWDSNWLAGHPSVGLMQVIRGTFNAYAGPYRGTGPFSYGVSVNPLANIYAALNYGKHGRGFGTGPGQIGSGHGYAYGTASALPGWAWVGERGPELVKFRGGEQVAPVHAGGGGDGLTAELRLLRAQIAELIRTTAAVPAATGRHVGGAISGAGADAAFRRRYPGR